MLKEQIDFGKFAWELLNKALEDFADKKQVLVTAAIFVVSNIVATVGLLLPEWGPTVISSLALMPPVWLRFVGAVLGLALLAILCLARAAYHLWKAEKEKTETKGTELTTMTRDRDSWHLHAKGMERDYEQLRAKVPAPHSGLLRVLKDRREAIENIDQTNSAVGYARLREQQELVVSALTKHVAQWQCAPSGWPGEVPPICSWMALLEIFKDRYPEQVGSTVLLTDVQSQKKYSAWILILLEREVENPETDREIEPPNLFNDAVRHAKRMLDSPVASPFSAVPDADVVEPSPEEQMDVLDLKIGALLITSLWDDHPGGVKGWHNDVAAVTAEATRLLKRHYFPSNLAGHCRIPQSEPPAQPALRGVRR